MDNIYDLINQTTVDARLPKGEGNLELSTEGFTTSISDFIDDATGAMSKLMKRVMNIDAYIQVPTPASLADIDKATEQYGWSALNKVRCFVPSKMNGKVSIHIEVVLEQAKALADYEKRVLKPLTAYCASVVSDPSLIESPVIMRDFKALDTDKMKRELTKTFNLEQVLVDMPYESTFGKSYSNISDIKTAGRNLGELREVMGSVDLDRLSKGEKRLGELLDELVVILKEQKASSTFIKTMADAVSSASIELEYVAAVAYYTTANINAFNESIKHVQATVDR